jgi:hypothetical protein
VRSSNRASQVARADLVPQSTVDGPARTPPDPQTPTPSPHFRPMLPLCAGPSSSARPWGHGVLLPLCAADLLRLERHRRLLLLHAWTCRRPPPPGAPREQGAAWRATGTSSSPDHGAVLPLRDDLLHLERHRRLLLLHAWTRRRPPPPGAPRGRAPTPSSTSRDFLRPKVICAQDLPRRRAHRRASSAGGR